MNQEKNDKKTYLAFITNPDVFVEMDDMKVISKATAMGCMDRLMKSNSPTTIALLKHNNECYAFIYFNPSVYSPKDAGFMYYKVKPDMILIAGLFYTITNIHKVEIKEMELLDVFKPNN